MNYHVAVIFTTTEHLELDIDADNPERAGHIAIKRAMATHWSRWACDEQDWNAEIDDREAGVIVEVDYQPRLVANADLPAIPATERIAGALRDLTRARNILKVARAPRALGKVRRAITSAGGALRHAEGKATRQ